jgi:hypothetical protein
MIKRLQPNDTFTKQYRSTNTNRDLRQMFAPAISLMNRLSYTKKFTLVGLFALAVIAFYSIDQFARAREQIAFIENELNGVTYARKLLDMFQTVQRHQYLTNFQIAKKKNVHTDEVRALIYMKRALKEQK